MVPISYVTSSFVNMLYCEIIVIIVALFSGVQFSLVGLLCLPVVMIIEYILALGITMILSAVDVYFRDLEHVMGIIAMAWMFMTPIMYDINIGDGKLKTILQLNPMTSIVTSYRDILYRGSVPEIGALGISLGVGLVFLVIGFIVFGKLKRRFSEVM